VTEYGVQFIRIKIKGYIVERKEGKHVKLKSRRLGTLELEIMRLDMRQKLSPFLTLLWQVSQSTIPSTTIFKLRINDASHPAKAAATMTIVACFYTS